MQTLTCGFSVRFARLEDRTRLGIRPMVTGERGSRVVGRYSSWSRAPHAHWRSRGEMSPRTPGHLWPGSGIHDRFALDVILVFRHSRAEKRTSRTPHLCPDLRNHPLLRTDTTPPSSCMYLYPRGRSRPGCARPHAAEEGRTSLRSKGWGLGLSSGCGARVAERRARARAGVGAGARPPEGG